MSDFKKVFLPIACVMLVVFIAWGLMVRWLYEGMEERGQFGDLFGGINALFSGLALAGVVTAVILQSRELELQRKELELTRDELKRTAEANEATAKALSGQIHLQVLAAKLKAQGDVVVAQASRGVNYRDTMTEMSRTINDLEIAMSKYDHS